MFFCHDSVSDRHFYYTSGMSDPGQLSKKQIQSLRLLRKRSERYAQKRFIVEGRRAVAQVLENRVLDVLSLIVSADYRDPSGMPDEHAWSGESLPGNIPVFQVSSHAFRQLADTDTAQGILAVCRMPDASDFDAMSCQKGVILAADRIQDPGNLGTMVRTAVWFGLKGLVLSEGTVDLFHPKVVRSTAGATGVLPFLTTNLPIYLKEASDRGWKIHLLDSGAGSRSYLAVKPTGRDLLVVGSEATGISGDIIDMDFQRVRVDPAGNDGITAHGRESGAVESLNASVASAIVMAHFCAGKK
ncbi:MAG: RNA methyltransferase [Balneolaceae bacterium]|nr:MAG: RNA methyltransferase [Balneolaceae bacterium]